MYPLAESISLRALHRRVIELVLTCPACGVKEAVDGVFSVGQEQVRGRHYQNHDRQLALLRQRAELALRHVRVININDGSCKGSTALTARRQPSQIIKEPDKVHVLDRPLIARNMSCEADSTGTAHRWIRLLARSQPSCR